MAIIDIDDLMNKALTGSMSEQERLEFDELLENNPQYKEKYNACLRAGSNMKKAVSDEFDNLPNTFNKQAQEIITGVSRKKMNKNVLFMLVITIVVIIIIAAYSILNSAGVFDKTDNSKNNNGASTPDTEQNSEITPEKTTIENYKGNEGWTLNTENGIITREPPKVAEAEKGGTISNLNLIKDKKADMSDYVFPPVNSGLNHYFFFEFKSVQDLEKFFPNYKKSQNTGNGYLINITKQELEKAIEKNHTLDFKYSAAENMQTSNERNLGQVLAAVK